MYRYQFREVVGKEGERSIIVGLYFDDICDDLFVEGGVVTTKMFERVFVLLGFLTPVLRISTIALQIGQSQFSFFNNASYVNEYSFSRLFDEN